MAEESPTRANQRIAQEIQIKFEFWLVGLVFAVLALAVQTAEFTGPRPAQFCELAAWLSLLLAGLLGIWRLEWSPPLYHLASRKAGHEAVLGKLQEVEVAGHKRIYVGDLDEPQDLESVQSQVQQNIHTVEGHLGPLQTKLLSRYRIMRVFLISGFVLLLISRGYDPALRLATPPAENSEAEMQSPEP